MFWTFYSEPAIVLVDIKQAEKLSLCSIEKFMIIWFL